MPSFEVASVRPGDPKAAPLPPNVRERGLAGVGGRFDMRRIQLTYLLMRAFDVESRQIKGPGWPSEQARRAHNRSSRRVKRTSCSCFRICWRRDSI